MQRVCLHTTITDTHCTYPQRDGQAELTWVAGYTPHTKMAYLSSAHSQTPIQVTTRRSIE